VTAAPYVCDLHAHTVRSDGNDTPYELVENAARRGLKVVALTDHDVLPPKDIDLPDGTRRALCDYARLRGVCLLPGIEFSCETTIPDVHIVGLGCDWDAPALKQAEKDIVDSKADAYRKNIERLNERGYAMTLEEVLSFGGQAIPIEELQKKRIFDLMAAKGYTQTWSEAKILVREDPYLNVEREKPSGVHVIDILHKAGGIAILAHPYLIDEQVSLGGEAMGRADFIERLIAAGLDGIEVRYTYNKTTCKDKRPLEQIWQEVYDAYNGRLILSGGSDYHADGKKGVENPRELGECGLTWDEFAAVPFFVDRFYL